MKQKNSPERVVSHVTMRLTKEELYIARDFGDYYLEFSTTGVPEKDAPKFALQKRFQDALYRLVVGKAK